MKKIQRYHVNFAMNELVGSIPIVLECDNGEWVKLEDVEASQGCEGCVYYTDGECDTLWLEYDKRGECKRTARDHFTPKGC